MILKMELSDRRKWKTGRFMEVVKEGTQRADVTEEDARDRVRRR